jgi:hypothetical protein
LSQRDQQLTKQRVLEDVTARKVHITFDKLVVGVSLGIKVLLDNEITQDGAEDKVDKAAGYNAPILSSATVNACNRVATSTFD